MSSATQEAATMNPTCEQCGGQCCRGLVIPAGNPTPEQVEWMECRGRVVDGQWYVDAPCLYIAEDGRCAIYATRPRVCREYAVGGEHCRATRRAYGREA